MKTRVKEKGILFDFLMESIGTATPTRVRKMIKNGHVLVNGRHELKPKAEVFPGQRIEVRKENARQIKSGNRRFINQSPSEILFEDRHFIVVHKKAGVHSVGNRNAKAQNLRQQMRVYLQNRPQNPCRDVHIINRLSAASSGLVVFVKDKNYVDVARESWQQATLRYVALVDGELQPREGNLKHAIKHHSTGKVEILKPHLAKKGTPVETNYKTLKVYNAHSLVELRPVTKERHQMRAQLAQLGHPITSDILYGATDRTFPRLALHLFYLEMPHPFKRNTQFKVSMPLPQTFKSYGRFGKIS